MTNPSSLCVLPLTFQRLGVELLEALGKRLGDAEVQMFPIGRPTTKRCRCPHAMTRDGE